MKHGGRGRGDEGTVEGEEGRGGGRTDTFGANNELRVSKKHGWDQARVARTAWDQASRGGEYV